MAYPKKLRKEPIIDTVCDIQFSSSHPESALPVLIANKLEIVESLKSLPISQIPEAMRKNDPNLKKAPLFEANLEGFSIRLGGGSVVIACTMPYVGWSVYKEIIEQVIESIDEVGLVSSYERIGYRTVNFFHKLDLFGNLRLHIDNPIEMVSHSRQYSQVVGESDLKSQFVVLNDASLFKQGTTQVESTGSILDVDSFWNGEGTDVDVLATVGRCHDMGKKIFFDLLSEDFLVSLEPEYE